MKVQRFAISVFSVAGVLLGIGSNCHAQSERRPALVVGITGVWLTDRDSYVPAENEPSDNAKFKPVVFLRNLSVNDTTCVYGTEGHVAVQFGDEVVTVLCKTDPKCDGKGVPLPKPTACAGHPVPPKKQETTFGLASLAMIIPRFRVKEAVERYVTPVSRGLDPELKDAVVQLRDGKVDLTPAFSELEAGSYKIRLESLSGSGEPATHTVVAWQEGGTAMATVPGLAARLYRARRVDANGTTKGQDAWILVCAPGQFAERSADYAGAVEATRKWPPEVDARAPQAVLRAYLEALSKGTEKEPGS